MSYAEGDVDSVSLITELFYKFTQKFSISARFPYKSLSGEVLVGTAEEDVTVNGFGDMRVNAGFTVYNGSVENSPAENPWVIKLGVGLILPTGLSEEEEDSTVLPIDLQPGQGTVRPLLSASVIQKRDTWSPFISLNSEISTGENDIDNERASKVGIAAGSRVPFSGEKSISSFTAGLTLDKALDEDIEGGVPIEGSDGLNRGIMAGVSFVWGRASLEVMGNYYYTTTESQDVWNMYTALCWSF